MICDPESEYAPLVEQLKGQVVRLSPTGKGTQFINSMDINLNYSEEENPVALKSEFILSVAGGRDGLQPIEKSVIQSAFEQPEDAQILTIYICTPIRTVTHRLLVRAERIY